MVTNANIDGEDPVNTEQIAATPYKFGALTFTTASKTMGEEIVTGTPNITDCTIWISRIMEFLILKALQLFQAHQDQLYP